MSFGIGEGKPIPPNPRAIFSLCRTMAPIAKMCGIVAVIPPATHWETLAVTSTTRAGEAWPGTTRLGRSPQMTWSRSTSR